MFDAPAETKAIFARSECHLDLMLGVDNPDNFPTLCPRVFQAYSATVIRADHSNPTLLVLRVQCQDYQDVLGLEAALRSDPAFQVLRATIEIGRARRVV